MASGGESRGLSLGQPAFFPDPKNIIPGGGEGEAERR